MLGVALGAVATHPPGFPQLPFCAAYSGCRKTPDEFPVPEEPGTCSRGTCPGWARREGNSDNEQVWVNTEQPCRCGVHESIARCRLRWTRQWWCGRGQVRPQDRQRAVWFQKLVCPPGGSLPSRWV